jgi:hypothetical protein
VAIGGWIQTGFGSRCTGAKTVRANKSAKRRPSQPFSERINREVASKSASHGGPQVMGSNAELLGWGTAVSVNDALNPEAVGKEHAVLFGMASVLDFVANANAAAIEAIKKTNPGELPPRLLGPTTDRGKRAPTAKSSTQAYRQAEGVLKSVPSPTTPAPTTPAPTTPAPTTPARPPTGSGTPVAAARGKLAKQLLDRGDMIAPISKGAGSLPGRRNLADRCTLCRKRKRRAGQGDRGGDASEVWRFA